MILVDVSEVLDLSVAAIGCLLEGVPELIVLAMLALYNHILFSDFPRIKVISCIQSVHFGEEFRLKLLLRLEHIIAKFIC
jgi:hypothetical protein